MPNYTKNRRTKRRTNRTTKRRTNRTTKRRTNRTTKRTTKRRINTRAGVKNSKSTFWTDRSAWIPIEPPKPPFTIPNFSLSMSKTISKRQSKRLKEKEKRKELLGYY